MSTPDSHQCPLCHGTGQAPTNLANGSKETCPKGHPYTEANTYRRPSTGWRECRTCRKQAAERRRGGMSQEIRHYAPGATFR